MQNLFLPVFFPHVCFDVQFLTQIQLMNQSIKCAQNWTQMNLMEDYFLLINLAIFNIKFNGIYKCFSLLEDFDFHLEVKLPKLLLPLPDASTGRKIDDNNNMEIIFLNDLVVYKTIQLQIKVKENLELSRNLHEFILFLRQITHVECQNQSPPLLAPPQSYGERVQFITKVEGAKPNFQSSNSLTHGDWMLVEQMSSSTYLIEQKKKKKKKKKKQLH
jgi:hypothetical protein